MPRTGKNLYKRKDGRWEGRYRKSRSANGRAIYGYVYARTYRDAKAKLEQAVKRDEEPGGAECISLPKSANLFQDVATEWLESIRPHVKESTSMKYRNLLESYIQPCIGTTPLSGLSQSLLESQCSELLNRGGIKNAGLSPRTVASVFFVIRTVLDYAAQNGKYVPCDAKTVKVKQNTREMRILSQDEQEKLCSYICSHPVPGNLGILVCLLTGLRIGEICALRWEDISLDEQTIHVHQTMQRIQDRTLTGHKTKIIITTPKSSCSIRTIPVPDDLIRLIKAQGVSSSGYFLTGSEKKYLEPRTMQYRFQQVLKKAGIPPVNFHSLRHTFATKCVELGFDVKTLSEILGHASVNITMNRYVHPSMGMKKENMQRISLPFLVK